MTSIGKTNQFFIADAFFAGIIAEAAAPLIRREPLALDSRAWSV
ncbi:hypothetical protein ACQKOE_11210 [Novosphingobium sp. NPDC080210]